jgi:hypothetical protein
MSKETGFIDENYDFAKATNWKPGCQDEPIQDLQNGIEQLMNTEPFPKEIHVVGPNFYEYLVNRYK